MKRLTQKYAKELLKEANYMDALAYFMSRIARFETYEQREKEREYLWNKMFPWTHDWDDEEDYSTNLLRIDSALYIAIESEC